MTSTAAFAEALIQFAARPRPYDVARLLIADGLAVAALGASAKGPRILTDLAREEGGRPLASVIGGGLRLPPVAAARINGAAMHVLDFEPMWNPANHAVSTTLPAILALAEMAEDVHGLSLGDRISVALTTGIEAQARLRLASNLFDPKDLTFHPPGIVGPIGAAVASGIFLGLDAGQMCHAVGIAASRASGILINVGSMTKALHCGQAAASGLEAALMAARGFTADADALSGPRGFGQSFFGAGYDPARLLAPADAPAHVDLPGPAFKLYPSQYGTHFVITAALEAGRDLPTAAPITSVIIRTPPMPYVDRPEPATGLAGKFSFQYVAAAALLDGKVNVATFTNQRRFAPDMVALLTKISIAADLSREGRFDRMRVDVTVRTDSGQEFSGHCDGPPGIWGKPLPQSLLANKWADCLDASAAAPFREEIVRTLQRFGDCGSDELRALMTWMQTAAEPRPEERDDPTS
ncbi:MmgE/PrpD family protein [Paracoccus sp. (in: a-proteobacteria)]|uniref:MmgE/PrpD family protein n=1 Tax=Paracoccus sp. TaxID=267 RepID=UPI002AFDF002|nr:MmgE/PrpD family protein [Paracoccus sp. (in: a-proteobacteria)]